MEHCQLTATKLGVVVGAMVGWQFSGSKCSASSYVASAEFNRVFLSWDYLRICVVACVASWMIRVVSSSLSLSSVFVSTLTTNFAEDNFVQIVRNECG
eukprot:4626860-Amphidinium_carterae.1